MVHDFVLRQKIVRHSEELTFTNRYLGNMLGNEYDVYTAEPQLCHKKCRIYDDGSRASNGKMCLEEESWRELIWKGQWGSRTEMLTLPIK